jgi:hypothetical protein
MFNNTTDVKTVSTTIAMKDVTKRNLTEILRATGGAKNGETFATDVALAWKSANLTDNQKLVLVRNFKKLSIDNPDAVLQQGLEKGYKLFEADVVAQLKGSGPSRQKTNDLPEFKAAIECLRKHCKVAGSLTWGNIGRVEEVNAGLRSLELDFKTLVAPNNRNMMMGLAFWNAIDTVGGSQILWMRSEAFFGVCSIVQKGVGWEYVDGPSISGGKTVISGYFRPREAIALKPVVATKMDQLLDVVLGTPKFVDVKAGLTLSDYLKAASVLDARILVQCKDFRQNRSGAQAAATLQLVSDLMLKTISWAGGDSSSYEGKDVSLDPKENGPFLKEYYRCLSIMRTTKRMLDNVYNGKKGGPDTRGKMYARPKTTEVIKMQ